MTIIGWREDQNDTNVILKHIPKSIQLKAINIHRDLCTGVPEWMRPHILAGFYQASAAGPLCEDVFEL